MAITHFLVQSNLSSTHLHPTKWSSCADDNKNFALKRNHSPCCIKTNSPKFNITCSIVNPKSVEYHSSKTLGTETGTSGMENVIKATLQISAITTGALVVLCSHQQALAASGGRMGGRSSCRSSFRSGSRSYSARLHTPTPSTNEDSSSESYSTAIGTPAPINPTQVEPQPSASRLFFSFLGYFVVFALKEWANGKISYHDGNFFYPDGSSNIHAKTTLLKLQVASLGTDRLLQKDLNRIAESADTSTSNGLHSVLQDSILSLQQHSSYCISGYSSVDVKNSVSECEKLFDQLSIEERGKFDEETLVNVNNIRMKSTTSQSSNGLPNEYIVVTIIVAARGVLELPPIKSSEQLKEALQKLASIPSSNVVGAEVLWTPQKEDDSLTEQEMLEDYPLLHTF